MTMALSQSHQHFVDLVLSDLEQGITRNKRSYELLAKGQKIVDQNTVKELTELAITIKARSIAHRNALSIEEKYFQLVQLYRSQVNLSHRTSQSILLQQYSTPAPISYLAGVFAGAHTSTSVFEPCAGNGLLALAARLEYTTVNEIDPVRLENLNAQGFKRVLAIDATKEFKGFDRVFESVMTNPPFGRLLDKINYGSYGIATLEHSMAIIALNTMRYDGRCSIIVGGHASYDAKGRIKQGPNRIFMNYLYHNYHVVDVINISGKHLYSRQGTGFDTRLILIDGRKANPDGHAPLYDASREEPMTDFNTLYSRVKKAIEQSRKVYEMNLEQYVHVQKSIYSLSPPKYNDWSKRIEEFKAIHKSIILEHDKKGYGITSEIQQDYPELVNSLEQHDMNVPDEFEEEARRLLEQQKKENGLGTLCQPENAELYLVDFQDLNNPQKKYQTFFPAYSLRAAERLASTIVLELQDNFPPIFLKVISVKKWFAPYQLNGLGSPYLPTSKGCIVLDTVVPDSMSFETHQSIQKVERAVGGNIDEFVRNRLGYSSHVELCKALAAEQIDAVAMTIYNIEARQIYDKGQGMIIGDQTGIGKGRIAAAIIRYAIVQGHKPIFLTEKANLFSDLYRDLRAIGGASFVPFIINAKGEKSDILDEDGDKIYGALSPSEQQQIFESHDLPPVFDFIMATYSQFNNEKVRLKRDFLLNYARNSVLILDEAHNASGSGQTGRFIQDVVKSSKGVLFLSATFAKRPDNMPLYALKTCLSETNSSEQGLINSITRGGVALQEVIASELVKEGQMLRRERSSEGVEVNYITLFEHEQKHRNIADTITSILRDIIAFQKDYIIPKVNKMDDELSRSQMNVTLREGTQKSGVDFMPYFSKVFQVINQMLFSIKAEAVADRAIERLREGKKPVIAFASTMATFLEDIENEQGTPAQIGDVIGADFSQVLRRGLDAILRYSVVEADGMHHKAQFSVAELGSLAEEEYTAIMQKIDAVSSGITISPIDVIISKIRKAGYSVAEVTGRKFELAIFESNSDNELGNIATPEDDAFNPIQKRINQIVRQPQSKRLLGRIQPRKRMVTNEAFRLFNNNQIDVLLINQSGSTGASAHAIPTNLVPREQVKQRVMLILQAELDISTEVQKRGRINRTGQIFKPIYDYITSAIPAEQRLMMMLQSKLKSLDANTTSNQKQSRNILDVPDFLNVYGNELVREYLKENPAIDAKLDHPLESTMKVADEALKVSGRVAVLNTAEQDEFYTYMTTNYNAKIEELKQLGEYNLEMEQLDLQAKTLSSYPCIVGKGGASAFGKDSVMELVEAKVLRKPYRYDELNEILIKNLNGKTPEQVQQEILNAYSLSGSKHLTLIAEIERKSAEKLEKIKGDSKLKEILKSEGERAYNEQLKILQDEIIQNREHEIEKIFRNHEDVKNYLTRIFKFFTIGKQLYFVVDFQKETDNEIVECVFLGFAIDKEKPNAFTPSNIKLRFALANSTRLITLAASQRTHIGSILSENIAVENELRPTLNLEQYWKQAIKDKLADRENRYIITGNLLQGLSEFSGKLISYTTNTNEVKKGILIPYNYFTENKSATIYITVPVSQAAPIFKSLAEGKSIVISDSISIFRYKGNFKMIAPLSRSSGGQVFLNENLLKLVEGNNFNRVSNTMVGIFDSTQLATVLKLLEDELGASVSISQQDYLQLSKDKPLPTEYDNFPILPMLEEKVNQEDEDDFEFEAQALLLLQEQEIELLKLNSKND